MFRRDREREAKGQNGCPPCGQVRVLVVGDSGFLILLLLLLLINFASWEVRLWLTDQTFVCSLICAFKVSNMYNYYYRLIVRFYLSNILL